MSDDRIIHFNVTDENGVLLARESLTRAELAQVQDSPLAAHVFVNEFVVGR
jgi:hypothetical protein